jgi:CMP-N,N'-diacetyllegionaminic acid synthase
MSRVLGVIPARGGSRGIPDKNLRPLAGRPLLAYAADAARDSGVIDRIILTTDSEMIAKLGRDLELEVPFLRPTELARDDTPMLVTLRHAVAEIESEGWTPEVIVLLQPTAPLRQGHHIATAVRILRDTGCSSVVSAVEIPAHYSPQYAMRLKAGRLINFMPSGAAITRRQDADVAYSRDGTVYVVRRDVLMDGNDIYGDDCRPLIIPASDSLNLDSPDDWRAAEARLATRAVP